ncbi:MAG: class I SAM-dependent methyltransferase [Mycobacterium leprae]
MSAIRFAEYYHSLASGMQLYQQTNRHLIELAELRPGMAVLDLACGTGLTSEAALAQVPDGLRLYLLDKSADMVAEAKRHIGDRATAYYVADALSAASLLPEKVDRVLCNMSFWQFANPQAVLQGLRSVVKPTGFVLFNLLGTYFNAERSVSPQWAFMQALFQQGQVASPPQMVERMPNQRSIEGTLNETGFKPAHFEIQTIASALPDTEAGGELYNYLRLYPVPGLKEPATTPLLLRELASAIERYSPKWKVAYFAGQPALSPEEAIQLRLGPKQP